MKFQRSSVERDVCFPRAARFKYYGKCKETVFRKVQVFAAENLQDFGRVSYGTRPNERAVIAVERVTQLATLQQWHCQCARQGFGGDVEPSHEEKDWQKFNLQYLYGMLTLVQELSCSVIEALSLPVHFIAVCPRRMRPWYPTCWRRRRVRAVPSSKTASVQPVQGLL